MANPEGAPAQGNPEQRDPKWHEYIYPSPEMRKKIRDFIYTYMVPFPPEEKGPEVRERRRRAAQEMPKIRVGGRLERYAGDTAQRCVRFLLAAGFKAPYKLAESILKSNIDSKFQASAVSGWRWVKAEAK